MTDSKFDLKNMHCYNALLLKFAYNIGLNSYKAVLKRYSGEQSKSHKKVTASIVRFVPHFRILSGIVALFLVLFLAFRSISDPNVVKQVKAETSVLGASTVMSEEVDFNTVNEVEFRLLRPSSEEMLEAKSKYDEKLQRIEEEKRRIEEEKKRERMNKITLIQTYLVSQGSPMAPYSDVILDSCIKYGEHYCKYFLAIAGVESGLGRVCPGHSAWGMIGFRFASWPEAISFSADWIAGNYYLKGVDTFEELAYSSYGPQNPETWITHLYSFYNQMSF
ncbi:MAG: hypothetical protein ABIE03_04575 [Patescibacteria group bacterium]|nr:hypothetical protein [Patescibacteria group bacterium]